MFFLFFVGIIEMLIVTAWTKVVTRTKVMASGAITMVNVLIWYYVLQRFVDDIDNWLIAVVYAFGCAVGTVLGTYYFQKEEERNEKDQKSFSELEIV
ncbi:MAG: DUF5698 domain-containing protein [Candidatus Pacebacteria bacterium]|nr:DUF5698 domain-containing protein [Candidatus Paceibacterota bacterium]